MSPYKTAHYKWYQEHWRPNAAIVDGDNLTPNAAGVAYMKLFQETFRFQAIFVKKLISKSPANTFKKYVGVELKVSFSAIIIRAKMN